MSIKTITAQDLYRRLKLGHNVILIDIRSEQDYHRGHIPGATSYPLEGFDAQALIHKVCVPFPTKPTIYITCDSGKKSFEACEHLAQQGYEFIIRVDGGMKAWRQAKLPLQKIVLTDPSLIPINLPQQMQISVGSLVVLGTLLGTLVNTGFLAISLLVGAGYIYEAIYETDYLKQILLKMPWNQASSDEPSIFKTSR
jgi:rhodanese-related sulfurtransferase